MALLACATAAVVAAPAAGAQVSSGGGFTTVAGTVTGQFTADGSPGASVSGHSTANTGAAESTTITLGPSRTLLTMSGLTLDSNDTLNFVFSSRSSVVLIQLDANSASVRGRINTYLDGVGGTIGGNVWITGAGGVEFGSGASVDAGGILATTGAITAADFFDGDSNFAFHAAPSGPSIAGVTLQGGSVINGHGGLVAFAAPSVQQGAGSLVNDSSAGSDVLYGAASQFTITTAADGGGDPDLARFSAPVANESSSLTPMYLAGTTRAGSIFVTSDSSIAGAVGPVIDGTLTANGAVASSRGDIVVATASGVLGTSGGGPQALAPTGGPAESVTLRGALAASNRITVTATGDMTLDPPAVSISGATVDLASGGNASNSGPITAAGRLAVTAAGDLSLAATSVLAGSPVELLPGGSLTNAGTATGQWVVYADAPEDIAGSGLDSGQTAIWGSDRGTHPPSALTGNRYVFSRSAALTFTAVSDEKDVGETTTLAYTVSGYQPALAGRYLADTAATAYSGTPSLVSGGAAGTAPERAAGPYLIDIEPGTVSTAASGYDPTFVDGLLTVDDTTPPTITGLLSGTPGTNGWYVDDVTVTWVVEDAGSEIVTPGPTCGPLTVDVDQPETPYTCTATSLGGENSATVRIARDTTAPSLGITGTSDGSPYVSGSWTDEDVAVDFTCSDATSGVDGATVPSDEPATGTTSYSATCGDLAGHTSPVSVFQVNIDRTDPTIPTVTATTGSGGTYLPGAWSDEDVTVSWTCEDTGGSGVAAPGGSITRSSSLAVVPVCEDTAGNSTFGPPVEVLVDKTAPQLHGVPGDIVIHTMRTPVTATWTAPTASDALSGLTSLACDHVPGETFERGSTVVTCTATDRAGNTATGSFDVVVKLVRVTFGSPVDAPAGMNTAKLGRIVPVKITLTVDGRAVTRTSPEPLYVGAPTTMSCSTARSYDAVETYTSSRSTGNLFRWNAASSRWLYNLPVTGTANTCYRVPIFYGGEVSGGTGSGGDLVGFFYLQPKK